MLLECINKFYFLKFELSVDLIIFNSNDMTGPSIPMLTSEGAVPLNLDSLNADVKTTPFERRFNPYDFNGGYGLINLSYNCHNLRMLFLSRTIVSIAGDDFAVCAGCTRISTGYEILSRNQSKLYDL